MHLNRIKYARYNLFCLVVICALTFAAFSPSLKNDFVNWDDPAYIHENPLIKELSFSNFGRIFTTFVNSNYQPLSVFTFAVEYHFAKLNPFFYHAVNVILHVFNTLLVYFFLYSLCKKTRLALIAALFFGIHPMRVESVAWISELKDVLFSFFFLCSLIGYVFYIKAKKRKARFYIFSLCFFFLSLFAKPGAVTFPFVLFLIDYLLGHKITVKRTLDKCPFFFLSLIFGLIAVLGTTIPQLDIYPIATAFSDLLSGAHALHPDPFTRVDRFFLVCTSLARYFFKLIWVKGLSCYYPYPQKTGAYLPFYYYLAPLFIFGGIFFGVRYFKSNRKLIFSLLFFVTTLSLNLPYKEMGSVSILGDRFCYIPYIGLFFYIGYVLSRWYAVLSTSSIFYRRLFFVVFTATIIFLFVQTWQRCQVWKDGWALWTDVVVKYPHAPLAYNNRGSFLSEKGYLDLALQDFNTAIKLDPQKANAYNNRGTIFARKGDCSRAVYDFNRAINLRPDLISAYHNRETCYSLLKKNTPLR